MVSQIIEIAKIHNFSLKNSQVAELHSSRVVRFFVEPTHFLLLLSCQESLTMRNVLSLFIHIQAGC